MKPSERIAAIMSAKSSKKEDAVADYLDEEDAKRISEEIKRLDEIRNSLR